MPSVGRPDERGDLFVTVDIRIPTTVTADERRHYEALKAIEEGRE
jgi:DnaJ-class molecular chaperone